MTSISGIKIWALFRQYNYQIFAEESTYESENWTVFLLASQVSIMLSTSHINYNDVLRHQVKFRKQIYIPQKSENVDLFTYVGSSEFQ